MWAVVLCLLVLLLDGYLLGLLQGFFIGTLPLVIGMSFLLVSGVTFQLSGAWGEDNTRDELRKAQRRGHIFGWVDNVEVQGGDVDHLVVGPSGLFALDSKWHSHGIDTATVDRDVQRARAAARRAESVLRSLQTWVPVTPVVVVWGGDQHMVTGTKTKKGVPFVAGRELAAWLRDQNPGRSAVDSQHAKVVIRALNGFKDRVRPG